MPFLNQFYNKRLSNKVQPIN